MQVLKSQVIHCRDVGCGGLGIYFLFWHHLTLRPWANHFILQIHDCKCTSFLDSTWTAIYLAQEVFEAAILFIQFVCIFSFPHGLQTVSFGIERTLGCSWYPAIYWATYLNGVIWCNTLANWNCGSVPIKCQTSMWHHYCDICDFPHPLLILLV